MSGYVPKVGLTSRDAARALLNCFYEREELEYADLEGPWSEADPGLLSADDFAHIAKRVWPPAQRSSLAERCSEQENASKIASSQNAVFGFHLPQETDLQSAALNALRSFRAEEGEIVLSNPNLLVIESKIPQRIWDENPVLLEGFGRIQTYLHGDPAFKVVATRWRTDGVRVHYFWRGLPLSGYLVPDRDGTITPQKR